MNECNKRQVKDWGGLNGRRGQISDSDDKFGPQAKDDFEHQDELCFEFDGYPHTPSSPPFPPVVLD